MGRGLVCAALAIAVSNGAETAPWTRDGGEWYGQAAILIQSIDGAEAVRDEFYGEYGVTDHWTVTAQAESLVFPNLSGFNQIAYRLTGRRMLWQRRGLMIAVEGGLVGGEAIGGTIGGCGSAGGEARVSFGGFGQTRRERNYFFFTDFAIREHGNCRRQRLEAGYGQEIAANWLSVNKVFLDIGTDGPDSAKVETTLLRRFGDTDIGFGVRQELGGGFSEYGVLVRVERRF